jgi:hypothetical protein
MLFRTVLASAILVSTCATAFADSVVGKILAYDRVAKIIVMDDKTVWTLVGTTTDVPPDLKAGDKVTIDYETAGEDGITKISSLKPAP